MQLECGSIARHDRASGKTQKPKLARDLGLVLGHYPIQLWFPSKLARRANMLHADSTVEELPSESVLIVGGGPVGLILAMTLAHHGVRSVLLERNLTTTRWPKMDLTTARSMEIFRALGIADGLRQRGVPSHYPFTCLFSSGLNSEEAITSWELPSVDEYRSQITSRNDGTMPLEPWQRVSQEVFEAWLKDLGDQNPMINLRFGWTASSAKELDGGAEVVVVDTSTGAEKVIRSKYAVGCDGANSVLRKSLGIELDGGPMYVAHSPFPVPSFLI